MPDFRSLSTDDLIARLRKAGSIWFRNDDLLMLEELIRRCERLKLNIGTITFTGAADR